MKTAEYTMITNECSCQNYDEDTDTSSDSDVCYGNCWGDTLEMFAYDVQGLLESNEQGLWHIKGFPLWHGSVDGFGEAHTARALLDLITPNTSWTLRYRVIHGRIDAVLSHHDAPTGGNMTVSIAKGDE